MKMQNKDNIHPVLVGLHICIATMRISVALPPKDGISLPQDPAILFLLYPTPETFAQPCSLLPYS